MMVFCNCVQAEKEGTVGSLVTWTVVGRPVDGRRTVSAARVSSTAPKKKAFDRGGPVWPPRSNAKDDRLGRGFGALCPPSQKIGVLGGAAPQPKPKIYQETPFLDPLSRKANNRSTK